MPAGADDSHFLNTLLGRGADVDGYTSKETTQRAVPRAELSTITQQGYAGLL